MWSRLTLRIKITIITAVALSTVAIAITGISVFNAGRIIFEPFSWEEMIADGYVQTMLIPADIMPDSLQEFTQERLADLQSHAQRDFQNTSIVIVAIFVLIGTAAAYIISGQVLKPIKSLAVKIEDIDTNNLSTLIEPPKSNDEVSSLTCSFNNMLGKIDRSFATQKLFAQNAAHELKTPLAFIRASLGVLELDDKPTEEEYRETYDIVKNSTDRLIELVERLLSLNSAVDEQKWQTFSSREILEIAVNEMSADIAERGISVDLSGDSRIKGDRTLLQRALSNLVHNAVRYNVDNGTVKITLSDEAITIEDSGVGIPAEHLPYIFEPFYCVDKSRSKKLGGHGLGMAIAKNIFDRHNMEIRIMSEVGTGTKIILTKQFYLKK